MKKLSNMEESNKEIRKLRKKLRQIHNLLALTRSLNEQEEEKVDQLDEIQAKLNELLSKQANKEDVLPSTIPTESFSPAEREEPVMPGDLSEEEEEEEEETEPSADEGETLEGPSPSKVARRQIDLYGDCAREEEIGETRKEKEEDSERKQKPQKQQQKQQQEQPQQQQKEQKQQQQQPTQQQHAQQKQQQAQQKQQQAQQKQQQAQQKQQQQQRTRKEGSQSVPWWRKKPRYFVQELVGHSDIVLDVSVSDGLVCSASRDTLVKVWTTDSGLLECTLSGHTEAVHACVLLPLSATASLLSPLSLPSGVRLVLSGGGDSSLLLWRVDSSLRAGSELRRIYTFTPITCLVHLPENGPLVVAVGTSSGKIEIWDVLEKTQSKARSIHRTAVSCIRLAPGRPGRLITCSEGGEVAVHTTDSLAPLFIAGDATPQPGRFPRQPIRDAGAVLAVDDGADWLLVGDGGSSLKLLQRGFREVKKIPNSKQEFGVCDGLWLVREDGGGIVFSTAFDVDSARGFLNVYNFTTPGKPSYLCSLQPGQFSGRYLCVDGVPGGRGDFPETLVTGGVDLLLWQRVAQSSDYSAAEVAVGKMLALHRTRDDEWSAGESGASSDEWTDEEEEEEEEAAAQWRWWQCRFL